MPVYTKLCYSKGYYFTSTQIHFCMFFCFPSNTLKAQSLTLPPPLPPAIWAPYLGFSLSCRKLLFSLSAMSDSFATLWTVVHQVLLSMGFPRQEYWNGLPYPPPGDLPNPGIKPELPVSPALSGRFFTAEPPGKPESAAYLN